MLSENVSFKLNQRSQRRMISRSEVKCQATKPQDAGVQDTANIWSVWRLPDAICADDNDFLSGAWLDMICSEDGELRDNITISNSMMMLEESCLNFHDQDYVEKIKEFEFYVDMMKKMVRPGCAAQVLDVALTSVSALFETLTLVSSKRCIRASL